MDYCVQNSETGEISYMRDDAATGGGRMHNRLIDEETGEPLDDHIKVRYVKHKSFQIPKEYLRGTHFEEFEKVMLNESDESYQPTGCITVTPIGNTPNGRNQQPPAQPSQPKKYKREDYMTMDGVKNEIIMGYNKVNYHLFLIPTLFFFNIYLALLTACVEMFLHVWAHRRNNLNMNRKYYYRSPLHILTSQFCGACRGDSEVDLKVFDMLNKQMRHARDSQTLKDVTKAIS